MTNNKRIIQKFKEKAEILRQNTERKIDRRGGFTLVELIVVMVIIVILASIMVPAITHWVSEAKDRKHIADARSIMVELQAEVLQVYAEEGSSKIGPNKEIKNTLIKLYGDSDDKHRVASKENGTDIEITQEKVEVKKLIYYAKEDGKKVTYENGEYKIESASMKDEELIWASKSTSF